MRYWHGKKNEIADWDLQYMSRALDVRDPVENRLNLYRPTMRPPLHREHVHRRVNKRVRLHG